MCGYFRTSSSNLFSIGWHSQQHGTVNVHWGSVWGQSDSTCSTYMYSHGYENRQLTDHKNYIYSSRTLCFQVTFLQLDIKLTYCCCRFSLKSDMWFSRLLTIPTIIYRRKEFPCATTMRCYLTRGVYLTSARIEYCVCDESALQTCTIKQVQHRSMIAFQPLLTIR